MEIAEIPKQQWEESLAPIRQRIARNYWRAAEDLIAWAYNDEDDKIEKQIIAKHDEADEAKQQALSRERDSITAITVDVPHDLEPLITFVRNTKIFKSPPRLITDFGDLDEDLRYFSSSTLFVSVISF